MIRPAAIDAAVLAMLPPETVLTVQVEAGALLRAMEARAGGPEELSTQQAAQVIGRTSKWWREHAPRIAEFWRQREGVVGAYLDDAERWRLLNPAARAYLAAHGRKETETLSRRSVRRGPRRAHHPQTGASR